MFALRILVHQLRMQLYRQLGKLMPQQRPMMFVGSGSSLHLCNLIAWINRGIHSAEAGCGTQQRETDIVADFCLGARPTRK